MASNNCFFCSPKYLFTSESVTEGHPDKICDQISDAVLDEIIKNDPVARVACDTAVTNGLVLEDNFYQALAQFEQSPSLSVQDFFNEMLKTVNE